MAGDLADGLAGGSGFGAGAPGFRAILRSISLLVLREARAKEAREGVGVAPAEAACSSASAAKPAAKRGVLHEKQRSSADIVKPTPRTPAKWLAGVFTGSEVIH